MIAPRLWQPVSTLYGGGHLFRAGSFDKLRAIALRFFEEHVPDAHALAALFGLQGEVAAHVYERLVAKLTGDPLEDVRIDFEDGYGTRSDAEEDADARGAALELAAQVAAGRAPRRVGLRIKAVGGRAEKRALATLDAFIDAYLSTGTALPAEDAFVVTLPKITTDTDCQKLFAAFARIEGRHQRAFRLRCELMIETPRAVLAHDGSVAVNRLVEACSDRCIGVHMGSYDLTASLDVAAPAQRMHHPYNEMARLLVKMAVPEHIDVSDGATNDLPLPTHRASAETPLSQAQKAENLHAIRRALRLHYENIEGSLDRALYQGWDLHPAQLTARWAAVYSFFLRARPAMTARMKNFLAESGRATNLGTAFDDMATGEGLYRFFKRGFACGALAESDVRAAGLPAARARTLADALAI